jgi:hypothetical protein
LCRDGCPSDLARWLVYAERTKRIFQKKEGMFDLTGVRKDGSNAAGDRR